MKRSHSRIDQQQVYTPYPLLNLFKVRSPHYNQQLTLQSWKSFIKQLLCPICKEVFNQPIYIKQCFHRFCKKCIETQIRQSNKKSCPSCRNTISKRLIRDDFQIQGIIKIFFGDIQKSRNELREIEQRQSYQALKFQRTTSQQQIINSMRKKRKISIQEATACKLQLEQSLEIKDLSLNNKILPDKKQHKFDKPFINHRSCTKQLPTLKKDQEHYIDLYLENHPNDTYRLPLQSPKVIIKLDSDITRVKKNIAKKLRRPVRDFDYIKAYIQKQGEFLQLENRQNLKDLIKTNWVGINEKIYCFIPKQINQQLLKRTLGFKRKLYFEYEIKRLEADYKNKQ